jgi:L-seryl-tRNA(Ser) seleniumtransferase
VTDPAPTRARPPSVERILAAARPEAGDRDPAAILAVARAVADEERTRLSSAAAGTVRTAEALGAEVAARLDALERGAGPGTAINATGVIVHTNLGRAPWPAAAIRAAREAAERPLFLELDRDTGRRGHRYREAEEHLVALTGAEDALVTNNNAAALALAVGLAGRGRGVAVSRGELVEIGGGVRIPEIVRRAGAKLIEVGTTNRTRVRDYETVLETGTARIVLRVHPSNFRQTGYVEAPDATELAAAAHAHDALLIDDLGSGALLDTAAFGLAHEPTPAERLGDGADLVTFSGDKLVGGPQAGFIVGRAEPIARLRRDPLARAMRPDKVILAAVAATLALYRAGVAVREIPVWRQIATPLSSLRARAETVAAAVDGASVVELISAIGGGSLPGETLPSVGLALDGGAPDRLLGRLRSGTPGVIARIEQGAVVLDLRTVEPADDGSLVAALAAALEPATRRRR